MNNHHEQRVRIPVMLTSLSLLLAPLPALSWGNLTVFGDSLSDGGNVGRYTWDSNTYPLYDEILARRLGQDLLPSSQGGSNYAEGGAVAVPVPGQENTRDQLDNYLSGTGGRASGDDLYIHWVGGNDLAAATALAVVSPQDANAAVENSAATAAAQVKRLVDAGAGTIIVPTVPNVGATPALIEVVLQLLGPAAESAQAAAFQSLNNATTPDNASRQQAIETALTRAAAQVSSVPAVRDALAQQLIEAWQALSEQAAVLSERYNQQEENGLVATPGNIVRADINRLFSEVIAAPGRYGISNTAGTACPPGISAANCLSTTPGFSGTQNYLFADGLHPSPAVHALIADYIQSILDAPAQVAALSQAPLAMIRDVHNTLDGHLQQQRHQPGNAGQFVLFGGYASQHTDNSGGSYQDGDATTHNLTLGVGYQLTDNWQLGALLSSANDRRQPSSHYDYRLRGQLAALWSQVTLFDQGWFNAEVHYADLDVDDIERRVMLGPASRIEQGNTDGKLLGMRAQAGWDLPLGSYLTTGPMVSYALDYGRIAGYREQGNSSSAMRFSDQTTHSQIGAVGWRIDSQQLPVNPWAQVSYNHQFGDTDTAVTAGLKTTRTAFSRTVRAGDNDWLDIAVGANVPLGQQISAFAAVSTVADASDYHEVTWSLGVNARF